MALGGTNLGASGLFTGRALYGTGVFAGVAEDVSDLVSMISPHEVLLLNAIGDPVRPAISLLHQWEEEELAPNALINSAAVASTAASTPIAIKGGLGVHLQVGMVLRGPEAAGAEYMQITAVSANTITVDRAFAGTAANSFADGNYLTVISDAAVEGADVLTDVSRPRPLQSNLIMSFKKDIIISDEAMSVKQHSVEDEFDHQKQNRTREILRDLEKAIILSRITGSPTGSATTVRAMRGLLQALITNSVGVSSATYGGGFTSTDLFAFESGIKAAAKAAWINGGTDLDLIVAGADVKDRFDQLNSSRTRTVNAEDVYVNRISVYEGTFINARIMLNRWMPTHKALILSSRRLSVVPLNGQSFRFERVARTGKAEKGMVSGAYTLEVHNEQGMAQVSFDALAPGAGQRTINAN